MAFDSKDIAGIIADSSSVPFTGVVMIRRGETLLTVIGNTESAAWPVARALDEFIRLSDGTTPESTEMP